MQPKAAQEKGGWREETLHFKEWISFPSPNDLEKLELDHASLPGAITPSKPIEARVATPARLSREDGILGNLSCHSCRDARGQKYCQKKVGAGMTSRGLEGLL